VGADRKSRAWCPLDQARARDEAARLDPAAGLVVVSDSGDNPTGGGVGDTPAMLGALLRAGESKTAT
jgi:microcystin degradation protein MlrC